jgi:hypothetical protein
LQITRKGALDGKKFEEEYRDIVLVRGRIQEKTVAAIQRGLKMA